MSASIDRAFIADFLRTLATGFRFGTAGNVDPFRFPGKTKPEPVGPRTSLRTLRSILRQLKTAAESVAVLADAGSRQLLLDLCAFRVLGGRHYRLRRNDSFFWKCVDAVRRDLVVERAVSRVGGYDLDLYRIDGVFGPIELEAHPMNVLNTFLVEEYRIERPGIVIEARRGDIVLDSEGC